jgi:type II secretory pathway pseudopilin PulG
MTKLRGQQGFTLLDMCITLIVVGLLLSAALYAYNMQRYYFDRYITQARTNQITAAIDRFFMNYGFYPCPAELELSRDNPLYGNEACPDLAEVNIPALVDGQPDRVLVRGTGVASPTTRVAAAAMLYGAVPVTALQLPTEMMLDGFGNKFSYAVTRTLTLPAAGPGVRNGALTVNMIQTVVDSEGNDATNLANSVVESNRAHYILISHGEDGLGAFSREGVRRAPCPNNVQHPRQSMNCTTNNVNFFNNAGYYTRGTGSLYIDDVIAFSAALPARMWMNNPSSDVQSTGILVGIGTPGAATQSLEVVGNVAIEDGNVIADRNCNLTNNTTIGPNCFTADIIGGARATCRDARRLGMTGISYNNQNCFALAPTGTARICPNGTYLQGIQGNGTISCGR